MIGFLAATILVGQEVPVPLTTLESLRDAVLKDEASGRASSRLWSLTRASWSATWGESAFGIGKQWVDTSGFGFRVPPDAGLKRYAGGTPFLVEGYRDGFPTFGIRRDGEAGLCRPLGLVYDAGGRCTNAMVSEYASGKWLVRALTVRAKTILAHYLNFSAPAKLGDFGSPWFKLVAAGYGTYWVDRNLVCVGPFGTCCRLIPEERDSIREILAGLWNYPPKQPNHK